MKSIRIAVLSISTIIAFSACSKKEEEKPSTPPVTLNDLEKHLVGTWKLKTVMSYRQNDSTNEMNDCEKDNIYSFAESKKYSFKDGSSVCSNYGTTATTDIDWSISSDSMFAFKHWPNYSGGVSTGKVKIAEITSSKLVLTQTYSLIGSVSQTTKGTYIKQ
jgi:hypothetical protein